jgi:hypothetical protein
MKKKYNDLLDQITPKDENEKEFMICFIMFPVYLFALIGLIYLLLTEMP